VPAGWDDPRLANDNGSGAGQAAACVSAPHFLMVPLTPAATMTPAMWWCSVCSGRASLASGSRPVRLWSGTENRHKAIKQPGGFAPLATLRVIHRAVTCTKSTTGALVHMDSLHVTTMDAGRSLDGRWTWRRWSPDVVGVDARRDVDGRDRVHTKDSPFARWPAILRP
jgi:hypothetical protein